MRSEYELTHMIYNTFIGKQGVLCWLWHLPHAVNRSG